MDQLNDRSVVEQQYATATNLQTRISIHDKYSTNKMGFGNWIFSNYKIDPVSYTHLTLPTSDLV